MRINRRRWLTGALAATAVAVPTVARSQTHHMVISRHRLPWSGRRRFRVIQYTDIHVGWGTPIPVLKRCVQVARRLKPDLVVLTGDYVNRSTDHIDVLTKMVSLMPAPVMAVLGNHDHWSDAPTIIDALTDSGAEVLQNESSGIERFGGTLHVVGVDDGRTKNDDVEKAFSGIRDPEAALILTHYPPTIEQISKTGGRLVLAGHTHGGQWAVPGLTQAVQSLIGNDYVHGWFDVGPSNLYVSAGIGQSLEGLRGGKSAVPEIAVFDLDPKTKLAQHRRIRTHLRG